MNGVEQVKRHKEQEEQRKTKFLFTSFRCESTVLRALISAEGISCPRSARSRCKVDFVFCDLLQFYCIARLHYMRIFSSSSSSFSLVK